MYFGFLNNPRVDDAQPSKQAYKHGTFIYLQIIGKKKQYNIVKNYHTATGTLYGLTRKVL